MVEEDVVAQRATRGRSVRFSTGPDDTSDGTAVAAAPLSRPDSRGNPADIYPHPPQRQPSAEQPAPGRRSRSGSRVTLFDAVVSVAKSTDVTDIAAASERQNSQGTAIPGDKDTPFEISEHDAGRLMRRQPTLPSIERPLGPRERSGGPFTLLRTDAEAAERREFLRQAVFKGEATVESAEPAYVPDPVRNAAIEAAMAKGRAAVALERARAEAKGMAASAIRHASLVSPGAARHSSSGGASSTGDPAAPEGAKPASKSRTHSSLGLGSGGGGSSRRLLKTRNESDTHLIQSLGSPSGQKPASARRPSIRGETPQPQVMPINSQDTEPLQSGLIGPSGHKRAIHGMSRLLSRLEDDIRRNEEEAQRVRDERVAESKRRMEAVEVASRKRDATRSMSNLTATETASHVRARKAWLTFGATMEVERAAKAARDMSDQNKERAASGGVSSLLKRRRGASIARAKARQGKGKGDGNAGDDNGDGGGGDNGHDGDTGGDHAAPMRAVTIPSAASLGTAEPVIETLFGTHHDDDGETGGGVDDLAQLRRESRDGADSYNSTDAVAMTPRSEVAHRKAMVAMVQAEMREGGRRGLSVLAVGRTGKEPPAVDPTAASADEKRRKREKRSAARAQPAKTGVLTLDKGGKITYVGPVDTFRSVPEANHEFIAKGVEALAKREAQRAQRLADLDVDLNQSIGDDDIDAAVALTATPRSVVRGRLERSATTKRSTTRRTPVRPGSAGPGGRGAPSPGPLAARPMSRASGDESPHRRPTSAVSSSSTATLPAAGSDQEHGGRHNRSEAGGSSSAAPATTRRRKPGQRLDGLAAFGPGSKVSQAVAKGLPFHDPAASAARELSTRSISGTPQRVASSRSRPGTPRVATPQTPGGRRPQSSKSSPSVVSVGTPSDMSLPRPADRAVSVVSTSAAAQPQPILGRFFDSPVDIGGAELVGLQEPFSRMAATDDGITIDAFVDLFSRVVRTPEHELRLLFRKFDANTDGTLTWAEFTQHLLKEKEEKVAAKYRPRGLVQLPEMPWAAHRHMIDRVCYVPSRNVYLTAGRDCCVCVWDAGDFSLVERHPFEAFGPPESVFAAARHAGVNSWHEYGSGVPWGQRALGFGGGTTLEDLAAADRREDMKRSRAEEEGNFGADELRSARRSQAAAAAAAVTAGVTLTGSLDARKNAGAGGRSASERYVLEVKAKEAKRQHEANVKMQRRLHMALQASSKVNPLPAVDLERRPVPVAPRLCVTPAPFYMPWVTDLMHNPYTDELVMAAVDRTVSAFVYEKGSYRRRYTFLARAVPMALDLTEAHKHTVGDIAAEALAKAKGGAMPSAASRGDGDGDDDDEIDAKNGKGDASDAESVHDSIGFIVGDVTGTVAGHSLPRGNFTIRQYHQNHAASITTAKLYPCGLVSSDVAGGLLVCDRNRWDLVTRFEGHRRAILSASYSTRLDVIASSGLDREICVWNPRLEAPIVTLKGHTGSVQYVAFNDDDMQLFSVGIDKTVRIWDVRTFRCVQVVKDEYEHTPENEATCALFVDSEKRLVTAGSALRCYEVDVGQARPGDSERGINGAVKFIRDRIKEREPGSSALSATAPTGFGGKTDRRAAGAAAGPDDPPPSPLDIAEATIEPPSNEPGVAPHPTPAPGADIVAVLDSKLFAVIVVVRGNGRVEIFDVEDGALTFQFKARHPSILTAACLDHHGKRLVTGAHDGSVRMWNYNNALLLHQFAPRECEITGLYFLPQNPTDNVLCGTDWNGSLVLWPNPDATDAVGTTTRQGHRDDVLCMAANGSLVVTGSADGRVVMWNAEQAKVKSASMVPCPKGVTIAATAIALLPRREVRVVGTDDGFLHFMSFGDGAVVKACAEQLEDAVAAITCDEHERFMAVGTRSGQLYFFSLHDANEKEVVLGPSAKSSAGKALLSMARDVHGGSSHRRRPAPLLHLIRVDRLEHGPLGAQRESELVLEPRRTDDDKDPGDPRARSGSKSGKGKGKGKGKGTGNGDAKSSSKKGKAGKNDRAKSKGKSGALDDDSEDAAPDLSKKTAAKGKGKGKGKGKSSGGDATAVATTSSSKNPAANEKGKVTEQPDTGLAYPGTVPGGGVASPITCLHTPAAGSLRIFLSGDGVGRVRIWTIRGRCLTRLCAEDGIGRLHLRPLIAEREARHAARRARGDALSVALAAGAEQLIDVRNQNPGRASSGAATPKRTSAAPTPSGSQRNLASAVSKDGNVDPSHPQHSSGSSSAALAKKPEAPEPATAITAAALDEEERRVRAGIDQAKAAEREDDLWDARCDRVLARVRPWPDLSIYSASHGNHASSATGNGSGAGAKNSSSNPKSSANSKSNPGSNAHSNTRGNSALPQSNPRRGVIIGGAQMPDMVHGGVDTERTMALIKSRDQRDREAKRLLEEGEAMGTGEGAGGDQGEESEPEEDDGEEWVFPAFDVLAMQLANITETFLADRPELVRKKKGAAGRHIAGALYR